MNAFEMLVAQLLEEEGFWVRTSVKIPLTPDEKRAIGKPTSPRPEIDIVAFDLVQNVLHLFEVKSYIDSMGVQYRELTLETDTQEGRYKLLTSTSYRTVLATCLLSDWKKRGLVNEQTTVNFGLVAGKVKKGDAEAIVNHCRERNWFCWGPADLKKRMIDLADKGYENNIAVIAAKVLLRD